MATIPAINLIFNSQNNTKTTFQSINQSLKQSRTFADRTSNSFKTLGQTIQESTVKTVASLRQSFDTTAAASKAFFGVATAGLANLSGRFIATANAAENLVRKLFEISNFLTGSQGVLGGESILGTASQVIRESLEDVVSFQEALPTVANLAGDFTKVGRGFADALGEGFQSTLSEAFTQAEPPKVDRDIQALEDALSGYEKYVNDLVARTNQTASGSVGGFQAATQALGNATRRAFSSTLPVLGQVLDKVAIVRQRVFEVPNQIGAGIANLGGLLKSAAGFDEAIATLGTLRQGVLTFAETIGNISQQIFFLQFAFSSLQQFAASGPFNLLIGQQVELRAQLLETQATLVATNRIIDQSTGLQLNRPSDEGGDPAASIVALTGASQAAIEQLRRDSLELVGVTSRELAEVFNITTTNLASSGVQSNNILKDAADLTIKFSAALGTIGLPLFQARQEISSILQGTIDQNSALAKTLNISNEQIRRYKEQGTLIENLNKRLETFRDGNALAAKSLAGVTSNLQEILEIVTLQAGKPLLDPLLGDLSNLFNFLSSNQAALVDFLAPIVQAIDRIRAALVRAGTAIGSTLGDAIKNVPVFLINVAANFVEGLADAIERTLTILEPVFALLQPLFNIAAGLTNRFGKIIIFLVVFGKTLQGVTATFKLLVNVIPGLGEGFAFLNTRGNALFGTLVNINKLKFNAINSAVLTLGANFDKFAQFIPGLNSKLQSTFGPFAGVIAGLIPTTSLFVTQFGRIVPLLQRFAGVSGGAVTPFNEGVQLAIRSVGILGANTSRTVRSLLRQNGLGELADVLTNKVVPAFDKIGENGAKELSTINDGLNGVIQNFLGFDEQGVKSGGRISSLLKSAGKAAVQFGLWAIAISAATIAFSEFIQRRKDAGVEIDRVSEALSNQAASLRNLSDGGAVANLGNDIADNSKLTKDWVDKIILLDRNFKLSELSADSLGDVLLSTGKLVLVTLSRIAAFFSGQFKALIVVPIQTITQVTTQFFISLLQGVEDIGSAFLKFSTLNFTGAIEEAGEGINRFKANAAEFPEIFREQNEAFRSATEDSLRGIVDGFGNTETKVEEEIREISDAVLSGELEASTQELVDSVNEVLVEGDAELAAIGEKISNNLSSIGSKDATGAERLAAITAAIDEVKESTKTGLISESVAEESIAALENFRNKSLSATGDIIDASEAGVEAFDAQFASLRKVLTLDVAQGRNTALEQQADAIQTQLSRLDATIERLEEFRDSGGAVDPEAIARLRQQRTELRGAAEAIDELRQNVDILPDPVVLFGNAIRSAEAVLKREQGQLTLDTQKDTQQTVAQFLEARLAGETAFTRDLEAQKAEINKAAIEEEIQRTREQVEKIQKEREKLTDSDLERAEEEEAQFVQLQTRLAQKEIELLEATLAEQQRLREDAEREIQQQLNLTRLAITEQTNDVKAQQQEFDRINKLIERQGDLLSANRRLLEAQVDSTISGFEFLAKTQRGDRNRQTVEETIAAIRLQAVQEQLKFDQISFEFEQKKTELALQREAISARQARLAAEQEVADASAAAERAQLDPELTQVEKDLANQRLQTAIQSLGFANDNLNFIEQQVALQPRIRQLNEQRFQAEQQNKLFEARTQRVSSIQNRRVRRQAEEELQRQIIEDLFPQIGLSADRFRDPTTGVIDQREAVRALRPANIQEFIDSGIAPETARQIQVGTTTALEDTLAAFLPQILSAESPEARQDLLARASTLALRAGEFSGSIAPGIAPSGQGVRFQGFDATSFLNTTIAPIESALGNASAGITQTASKFGELLQEIRRIATQPTYEVNVSAGGQSATTTGNASRAADLQAVISAARRFATSGI